MEQLATRYHAMLFEKQNFPSYERTTPQNLEYNLCHFNCHFLKFSDTFRRLKVESVQRQIRYTLRFSVITTGCVEKLPQVQP